MFNFKASFLMVLMLSVIYISSNSSDDNEESEATLSDDQVEVIDVSTSDDQEEHNETVSDKQVEVIDVSSSDDQEEPNVSNDEQGPDGFTICKMSMDLAFKGKKSTIDCIKYAIKNMILYGNHKFTYENHVKMYYQSLYRFVKVDLIKTPLDYCKAKFKYYNEICHEELKIFEREMTYENVQDSNVLRLLDATLGYPYNFSGVTINPQGGPSSSSAITISPQGGSSSSASAEKKLKIIILKNALYYHKIGLSSQGHKGSEEASKYFHVTETHGAKYMSNISGAVRLISVDMDTPEEFCRKLYLKRPLN